ncbi:sodium:calcium antiporter [Caldivirga maquilingensis]|uniref:Sodium/calcium exchanger membrane region n=1 Tax=Caldivirga maquilingensis (strain ATCC 700844 / DSM 13496 / JCM 10307 / IC-167) TaxID=397948 RepID=A8MC10_CALMQ|nr:sodium/hydrogen exchanger [Caldivirga maquilingensis]ABW02794.1 sodium/calcium exchanger membrane region [Caldivirga maquilingensis IC-167]
MGIVDVVVLIAIGVALTFTGGLLFTNALEYMGGRSRIGESFIGAIISPIFTSMPELIIFAVALYLYGGESGQDIGIGTVMGEPFMISTIVFPFLFLFVTIGRLMGIRDDTVLEVNKELIIPYLLFTALYPTILLPALISNVTVKYTVALLLILTYLIYIKLMYSHQGLVIEDYEEPYLSFIIGLSRRKYALAITQAALALVILIIGSRLMVYAINEASSLLSIDALSLTIIIVPLATVLPESITAVIWVLKNRDTMAVAALVGEKVLYSTIYPALGLLLTHWRLTLGALVSVIVVEVISMVVIYHIVRRRLTPDVAVLGLMGYVAYIILVFHLA